MSEHLRQMWRRTALPTSWRPIVGGNPTDDADCVIIPQYVGTRRYFEVYTYGVAFVNRPTLAAAKEAVEEIYGPLVWTRVDVPKVEVVHYYYGPTEEFSDPTTIYTADLPRLGATASSGISVEITGPDWVGDYTVLAKDGDRVVGRLSGGKFNAVEKIFVDPGYRRRGIATQMYRTLAQAAGPMREPDEFSDSGAAWFSTVGTDPRGYDSTWGSEPDWTEWMRSVD